MSSPLPAIPEHRARGHAQWQPGSAPAGVVFLGRTSTSTMQDPVESLLRQYRQAGERLPEGMYISRCYWDIESGGIELDSRSQAEVWKKFTDAGIPRDGGMAEFRAAVAAGERPAAVICESASRVSRDMLDSLTLERELKKAGVLILATSEPIDMQAPQGSVILMRRMHQAEAEYFRLNLKTLMWEGLKQYAVGGHNTGKCPYGYAEERTPHPNPMKANMGATRARLIRHPEHAQWVTKMFDWRAYQKLSCAGIARRLTALGVPNPSGGPAWSGASVQNILENPKYTGRVVLGRSTNTGTGRRKGERKLISLPREYWTWADDKHAHEPLTDTETWELAQETGRKRNNTSDPGTRRPDAGRIYPYRGRIHHGQCHHRMHGGKGNIRQSGEYSIYYICPVQMHKPQDKARYPDHVRASVREDVLTAALSLFLDQHALGHDRAAQLTQRIPATQERQDDINAARKETLNQQLSQARESMNGIAAEMGRLAGKDDALTNAIRDRLTGQFGQRKDEETTITAELAAIQDAAPLPADDLTLIDELPHAPGLLSKCPPDLQERLAAAFDLQAVYRPEQNQATVSITITETTPGIIQAILEDPRTDSDTGTATASPAHPDADTPATSQKPCVDLPSAAIADPKALSSSLGGVPKCGFGVAG